MKKLVLLLAGCALFSVAANVAKYKPPGSIEKCEKQTDVFVSKTTFEITNSDYDFNNVAVLVETPSIDNVSNEVISKKSNYKSPAITKRIYLMNKCIKIC